MKGHPHSRLQPLLLLVLLAPTGQAANTTFFNATQAASNITQGATSETLTSSGYVLTRTLDKWWSPTFGGPPTGRFQSVFWPTGLHAQGITAGPSGPPAGPSSAVITVRRVDGQPFDLCSFTAKLLANTAGAGASFEIMPKVNGQDAFPDPLALDATGYGGNVFTHSTPMLQAYDSYDISLWVDFALIGLSLYDPSPAPPPVLYWSHVSTNQIRLSWTVDATGFNLQSTSDLQNTPFANAGLAPSVQGGLNVVTLLTTDAHRFFRLAQ